MLVDDTDDVLGERLLSGDEVAGDAPVPVPADVVGGVVVTGGAVVSGETDGEVVGVVDPGGGWVVSGEEVEGRVVVEEGGSVPGTVVVVEVLVGAGVVGGLPGIVEVVVDGIVLVVGGAVVVVGMVMVVGMVLVVVGGMVVVGAAVVVVVGGNVVVVLGSVVVELVAGGAPVTMKRARAWSEALDAIRTWGPGWRVVGTCTWLPKSPRGPASAEPAGSDPFQLSLTFSPDPNPEPTTVTVVPTGPLWGSTASAGAATAATPGPAHSAAAIKQTTRTLNSLFTVIGCKPLPLGCAFAAHLRASQTDFMPTSSTILCRIHGRDRPGITAGLMDVLSSSGAELYDVEQVVVRGRLTLDVLFSAPEGRSTVKDLLFYGWESDLQIDFEVVEEAPSPANLTAAVTIVGRTIGPSAFGATAGAIAKAGGNIDRIVRLSRYPVVSYELIVAEGDVAAVKENLVLAASDHDFDVAVQEERLERRMKRLVVIDVDSTLIQDEVIDLLAVEAGVAQEVHAITAQAMEGQLDFGQALERRVSLLGGLEEEKVREVARRVELTPGARTLIRTLKRAGMQTAIVSGGFTHVTDLLAERLEVDHSAANRLEVADGKLTGRLVGDVVDRAGKAAILSQIAAGEEIPLEQTVAVGDGANDLDMLATAGLGIAFNARKAVREAADTSLNVPYLDAILFMLGIPRRDIGDDDPVPVPGLPPV